jgi:hypothetical protein
LVLSALSPGGFAADEPLKVVSSSENEQLTRCFQQQSGWTGADGAYSAQLDQDTAIWLFGDTFIGQVKNGRRIDSTMINNSIGVQKLPPLQGKEPGLISDKTPSIKFYWNKSHAKPMAIFNVEFGEAKSKKDAPSSDTWFWPGSALAVNGKLYVFLHKVKSKPADKSSWGFEGAGNELARVENPHDEPEKWRVSRVKLSPKLDEWGTASIADGDFIYVFASYPQAAEGFYKHPAVLARISRNAFEKMDMSRWQILAKESRWESLAELQGSPQVLMLDAAPEMSVARIRGISGFIATYTPAGLGETIVIRHSEALQGPWSESQRAFIADNPGKGRFTYSAKAHPEQSSKEGELVVTYCRNSESFQENIDDADIYRPRVINLQLQERK